MTLCDVCGKDTNGKSDQIRLYTARVKGHAVERGLPLVGGEKMTTTYERFQPLEVTVCRRHRLELVKQRFMPGLIAFVVLYLIVSSAFWAIFRTFGGSQFLSFGLALVVALALVYLVLRLISYDGIVAMLMTQRDRPLKLGLVYLTERKYQRLTAGAAQKPAANGRKPGKSAEAKQKKAQKGR
ncbi:MAG TPA: hypothetical protein VFF68_04575 [Anaerolineaceae bacterium]|nr:hypothetical protein [Anaerolineaceae bacterium]